MSQLELAQKDPTHAFKAATAIKTLSLAAAGIQRLHELKVQALGLDQIVDEGELPTLHVHIMSREEEEAIRNGHGEDENLDEVMEDDEVHLPPAIEDFSERKCSEVLEEPEDDVIEQGFEDELEEDSARPEDERRDEDGFRIVRAAPGSAPEMRAAPVISGLAREAKP
jgi:hypothetical protein